MRTGAAALGAAIPIAIVAAIGLSRTPLRADEQLVLAQARAVAADWRDTEGHRLPLYFHAHDSVWLQPSVVYASALWLKVASPASPTSVRAMSVLVGALDAVLMYAVARRLFRREPMALVAAVSLGLAPAHFIYSRAAVDSLYPVPFVLAWLWCVVTFLARRSPALLFAGGLCLGIGVGSHPTSVVMMPIFLAMTYVVLLRGGRASPASLAAAIAGFAVPMLVLGAWIARHPDAYLDTVGVFGPHPAHVRNPIDGVRAFLNWNTLTTRVTTYWSLLDPSWLFVGGPVLLLSQAPFVVAGVRRLAIAERGDQALLVLGGLVAAPFAASAIDERHAIGRALIILPFAALIAAYGVLELWSASRRWRCVAAALLVLMAIEFGVFARGYLTNTANDGVPSGSAATAIRCSPPAARAASARPASAMISVPAVRLPRSSDAGSE